MSITIGWHNMDVFASPEDDMVQEMMDLQHERNEQMALRAKIRNDLAEWLSIFDGELPSYEHSPMALQEIFDRMWADDVGYWEEYLWDQKPTYYGYYDHDLEFDPGSCAQMIDQGRISENEPVLSNGDCSSKGGGMRPKRLQRTRDIRLNEASQYQRPKFPSMEPCIGFIGGSTVTYLMPLPDGTLLQGSYEIKGFPAKGSSAYRKPKSTNGKKRY